jgi:hypothetical protein
MDNREDVQEPKQADLCIGVANRARLRFGILTVRETQAQFHAQPITYTPVLRWTGIELATLEDVAKFISLMKPFRQAFLWWQYAAELVLTAAATGKVAIALFGYLAEDRAVSSRDLPRHQSEPGAKIPVRSRTLRRCRSRRPSRWR